MLRVGLTGGIGSGKSTAAQHLSALGAVVVDADTIAREVVEPGSEGLAAVVERFGEGMVDDAGALNRAALGAVVFADPDARRDLEGITHPLIARRTAELVAAAPADAVVVHDVPLLVEKSMGAGYHLVLVVGADERTRLHRLTRTRGMTEADARARIVSQAGDDARRAAADVWLDNEGAPEQLRDQVDVLWRERLVPYERNVREGRRVRLADPVTLVPHDPGWAPAAARLSGRLRRVFGGVAMRVDHVGSTAVPGLVAKDVVDLQVGVRSLEEADDAGLVERLREAGFPRVGDVRADNAKDGGSWPKRFHGGCDPGRVVHVHVREVGSPGWRWALAFRDWLRAIPGAREEYGAEKARLVAGAGTVEGYAVAKEGWFDAAHERVEAWVAQSGWEPGRG